MTTAATAWSAELRITVEQVLPGARAGARAGGDLYRVLPTARRARTVVPARDVRASAAALRGYGRLQPARRAVLRRLSAPVLARARPVPPGDLLTVPAGPDGLRAHLQDLLGLADLRLAVPVRALDPHSKPTVQVLTNSGRTVGFCKVGTGPAVERLRVEAAGLRRFAALGTTRVRVPELLHEGEWNSRGLVLTAPVPAQARRLRVRELAATWPALLGLQEGADSSALGESSWPGRSRARLERLADAPGAGLAREMLSTLTELVERHGATELLMGELHGDWTPWNLAVRGNELWCWDLEHSDPAAPFGTDVVHGLVHVGQHVRRQTFAQACRAAASDAADVLPTLGLSTRATSAVIAAGLWDVVVRACEVRGRPGSQRPDWQPGLTPDVLLAVLHSARQPADAPAPSG